MSILEVGGGTNARQNMKGTRHSLIIKEAPLICSCFGQVKDGLWVSGKLQ